MPQVVRFIPPTALAVDRLEQALASFRRMCGDRDVPEERRLKVYRPDEEWVFEESDEFFEELRRRPGAAEVVEEHADLSFRIEPHENGLSVTLRIPSRRAIDDILEQLDLPSTSFPHQRSPVFRIFVGHGRNIQWLALVEHLRARHSFQIETYETAAGVGQAAMDVLSGLAAGVSFALLVHTAEVVGIGDTYHAGPNVIHETGYFQASLGISRALILREETCHPFANVAGLSELRFQAGHIQEVFGDVVSRLRAAERLV